MDNNIDNLLYDIGKETPIVNPYLGSKIYSKAKEKELKKNIPFFKKPLIISFSSLIAVVVLLIIILQPFSKGKLTDKPDDSITNNPFIPTLSPNNQNTVFIEYHYTIYNNNYDTVTLIINNKINYQRIYLKAYSLDIKDININNADVTISKVEIENQVFFEIVFNNNNTTIHYLDLCFTESTIENILKYNPDYQLEFIMYVDEVDALSGYGYKFKIKEIYDLRNGTNI